MNKLILWSIVAVVAIGGVWYYLSTSSSEPVAVTPTPSASTPSRASISPRPSPKASEGAATPSVTPHPSPEATEGAATPTPSQSPGIVFQEVQLYTVEILDMSFSPASLTVKKGDLIVFKNIGSFTQTVTSLNLMFNSRNVYPGGEWQLETANLNPGTYEYKSTLHTVARGTIIIQ